MEQKLIHHKVYDPTFWSVLRNIVQQSLIMYYCISKHYVQIHSFCRCNGRPSCNFGLNNIQYCFHLHNILTHNINSLHAKCTFTCTRSSITIISLREMQENVCTYQSLSTSYLGGRHVFEQVTRSH